MDVKEKIGFLNAFYRIKDRKALTEKLSLREFVRSFVRPYSRCDPKNADEKLVSKRENEIKKKNELVSSGQQDYLGAQ